MSWSCPLGLAELPRADRPTLVPGTRVRYAHRYQMNSRGAGRRAPERRAAEAAAQHLATRLSGAPEGRSGGPGNRGPGRVDRL